MEAIKRPLKKHKIRNYVETVKEVVDTEEFALIRDNAKSIVSNFNKLDKKITKLPKRDIGDKSQRKEFKHLV